jgi:hypothetical protein
MQARHIDTCLGCYLLDHHNRPGELLLGATVDGNTTQAEVLWDLIHQLQGLDIDSESFDYDSAKACLKSIFAESFGTILDGKFDASLETPTEEELEMSEPCQAWFLLTWDEADHA